MAFKKIKMVGVFASDMEAMYFGDEGLITYKNTQTELNNANGGDIEVDLSSVGGLVDVATDIFIAFRDYKRDNPTAQLILNIKTQASSAASFFAAGEFWDMITVEDISSWMIHNPANYMFGDYQIMQENADYLKRLSALYSSTYAKRSKKTDKEIRSMMDKTTFLYGQEIVDAGFADEVLSTSGGKNKDSDFAKMQMKYKSMMSKIRQIEMKDDDFHKAVASIEKATTPLTMYQTVTVIDNTTMQKPAKSGENNNQEEVNMTAEELKKANPDTFAGIEMAGVDKERARVKSLTEMKKRKDFEGIEPIMARIDEGIENGESQESVFAGISAILMKNSVQASLESPGNINGGGETTMSGEGGKPEPAKVTW